MALNLIIRRSPHMNNDDHCDDIDDDHDDICICRSPHMNNEEPIEMSHYPDGKKKEKESIIIIIIIIITGKKEEKESIAPIERDDFPAPPFLYADEVPALDLFNVHQEN